MINVDVMNIQYTAVRNPKWGDSDNTIIDCEVNFTHLPEEWVGFASVASGDYPHTHKIYQECLDSDYGPIAAYGS